MSDWIVGLNEIRLILRGCAREREKGGERDWGGGEGGRSIEIDRFCVGCEVLLAASAEVQEQNGRGHMS